MSGRSAAPSLPYEVDNAWLREKGFAFAGALLRDATAEPKR